MPARTSTAGSALARRLDPSRVFGVPFDLPAWPEVSEVDARVFGDGVGKLHAAAERSQVETETDVRRRRI